MGIYPDLPLPTFYVMGFWNKIQSGNTLPNNWISLDSINQLNAILDENKSDVAIFFKHSTRCGISMAAKRRMQSVKMPKGVTFYYLDLLKHRDVSDALASRLKVVHQSPQLIVVKNGAVIGHGSHEHVNADLINLNM